MNSGTWAAADEDRLKMLHIRPSSISPDDLRSMVGWLKNNKRDPKGYPIARLYDRKAKNPAKNAQDQRVFMSRSWVLRRLRPAFEQKKLEWIERIGVAVHPEVDVNVEGQVESGRSETAQGRARVLWERFDREVSSRIWVPEPDHVPIRKLEHGDGIHEELSQGTPFKWLQENGRIETCWIDPLTYSWFENDLLPLLGRKRGVDHRSEWRTLQIEMCAYLEVASQYNFEVNEGWGSPTLAQVRAAVWVDAEDPGVQRVQYLDNEFPRLKQLVAEFVLQVNRALRLLA